MAHGSEATDGKESAAQREMAQVRPFHSKAEEAVVGLLRTANLLRHRFAAAIEPHAITLQQYNVLRILRGADAALPTMEIGRRMIEPTPGITRLIDRLEKKGLVKREQRPEDRRQVFCAITATGVELVGALDQAISDLDEGSMAALSPAQQQTLIDLLDTIRAASSD